MDDVAEIPAGSTEPLPTHAILWIGLHQYGPGSYWCLGPSGATKDEVIKAYREGYPTSINRRMMMVTLPITS